MIWIGIGIIVLCVFLLASGSRSGDRTAELYRRTYTREELEQLAAGGSSIAKKALQ